MDISLSGIQLRPSVSRRATSALWEIGQILNIRVDGPDRDGLTRIRVGAESYRAASSMPLPTGTQIQVKVTQTTPVIRLTPLRAPITEKRELVRAALTQHLPKQVSFPNLIATVDRQLAVQPTASNDRSALPTLLADAATKIRSMPVELATLREPPAFKKAIENSGVLMERGLARQADRPTQAPNHGDLKWQLLALKRAFEGQIVHEPIRPRHNAALPINSTVEPRHNSRTPITHQMNMEPASLTRDSIAQLKALVSKIDGAISRIEVNQLKTAQSQIDGQQMLRFDLPISTPGGYRSVEFEIERDADAQHDGDTGAFLVNLRIPVSDDDEIAARIHWRNGATSIRLWSENEYLRNRIDSFQQQLVDALEQRGIKKPIIALGPGNAVSPRAHDDSGLIDTSA